MTIVINKHIIYIGLFYIAFYQHRQELEQDFNQYCKWMKKHTWENKERGDYYVEYETDKHSFRKCLIMAKAFIKCCNIK